MQVSLRRMFVVVSIVSLLLSYLGVWVQFIKDPTERTGSDFIAFYSAGRIAQKQSIANVYNPLLQQQIQQEEVGFSLVHGQILLYNHLPFLIPVLQLIVTSSYVASFYRWIFLLITLYIVAVIVLSRILKQTGMDRNSTLLTAIGTFLFLPLFFSLMNGQDTAFLFLGVAIWMYGLLSGGEMLAGLGLSLATVRPHIALFLAIPMLFRHPRVFWGFLLGSGILATLSVLILGPDGTRDFIDILLLSAGGEWYGMKENAMFNFIGLLTRTVPQLQAHTIRLLGWILYALAIIGSCILWFKAQDSKDRLIGWTVILALFVAPHLHFHDLALFLIPLYAVVRTSGETGHLKTSFAVVMPMAISFLLLISNISPYLQYTTPYLVMLLIGYLLYPKLKTPVTALHRP